MNDGPDRRKERTRRAILGAFNELIIEGDLDDIRVSDIVQRANVGRSTFYEHFSNADDLFMQAFSYPLSILADGLTGRGDESALESILQHLWENRARGRRTFRGRTRERITHLLLSLLRQRHGEQWDGHRLRALSEAVIGLVRAWLNGEMDASVPEMTQAMASCAYRLLAD